MRDSADQVDLEDESKGCINIRVGFHSGPTVAALVSGKYTLLGGEPPPSRPGARAARGRRTGFVE